MRVPVDADVRDAVVRPEDGDERHARLDQPPGLQHRLAVRVHAVALADAKRLVRQIEGPRRGRVREQREGTVVVRRHRLGVGMALEGGSRAVKRAEQPLPVAGALGVELGAQARTRRRGSPASRRRRRSAAGRTSAPAARALAVALLDEPRRAVGHDRHHRDVRRQRPAAAALLRQHRAVVRPVVAERARRAPAAGEQVVRARSGG